MRLRNKNEKKNINSLLIEPHIKPNLQQQQQQKEQNNIVIMCAIRNFFFFEMKIILLLFCLIDSYMYVLTFLCLWQIVNKKKRRKWSNVTLHIWRIACTPFHHPSRVPNAVYDRTHQTIQFKPYLCIKNKMNKVKNIIK